MPEPEYYEVHIIKSDGATWCGHIGTTKEEAIKTAKRAFASLYKPSSGIKAIRMKVFACTLVDTIELNP